MGIASELVSQTRRAKILEVADKSWAKFAETENPLGEGSLFGQEFHSEIFKKVEVDNSLSLRSFTFNFLLSTLQYPYICMACEALQHGRNSQLLHKLSRALILKHTYTKKKRACFCGLRHKYVSSDHLQVALSERTSKAKSQLSRISRKKRSSAIAGEKKLDRLLNVFSGYSQKTNFPISISIFLRIGLERRLVEDIGMQQSKPAC